VAEGLHRDLLITMDLYKKLKAKIEEFNEETDLEEEGDVGGPVRTSSSRDGAPDNALDQLDGESTSSQEVIQLRQEVRTLKAHIQNNYNVYVKRLDKRKARIKDLEEYAKLIVKDNETLTNQLQDSEGYYKKQLAETRDNLEQMEGFQNQELSKVKHMLLSAETSLETERSQKKAVSLELEQVRAQYDHLLKATADVPARSDQSVQTLQLTEKHAELISKIREDHEVTVKQLAEQIQDLEGRLEEATSVKDQGSSSENQNNPDCPAESESESGQESELKAALNKCETVVIPELRDRLKKCQQERDSVKNSLIEVEIAKHEAEEAALQRESDLKMKITQLTTEKETLEVTLRLRDNELKNRKEESRQDREKSELDMQSVRAEMVAQSETISALQKEISVLNGQLTESRDSFEKLSGQHQSLMVKCASLTEELESKSEAVEGKDKHLNEVHQRLDGLHRDFDDMVNMNHQLESNLCQVKDDSTRQSKELDDLKEAHEELLEMHTKAQTEVKQMQEAIQEAEDTFPERLESSELVQKLRQSNSDMSDELAEKKQSVKLLQQRMNDMKKTFQKEMKTAAAQQAVTDDEDTAPTATSSLTNGSMPYTVTMTSSAAGSTVDLAYLKHVIFKFLTSREYEAKQLTRAVATLLQFSKDEEKLLRDHLEWKTSWFGNLTTAKPDLGQGQFSLSLNPS